MPAAGQKRAEARCRYYTRDEAKRLGWDVRHPSQGGMFLEEQELVDYYPALRTTLGDDKPDFGAIARDGALRAIIECKNDYRHLDRAIQEAREYAEAINRTGGFDVRLAVGVAGTPDKFVQTRGLFRHNGEWVSLTSHGYPLTQLPTLAELDIAITNADGTTDVQLPGAGEFFDAAINISRILRRAKVEEPARPKVIGAMILALYHGEFSLDRAVVLEHINSNVRAAVAEFQDVPTAQREFLAQTLALSTESHRLRSAVGDIVHQLERLNIRSIVRSGVDFLGEFYEAFLRYGCDSTKMGIVFTPRHITRYCAELTDVYLGSKVYDPACGTGGFLVAAFDRMMKEATTPDARKKVKSSLSGCDTNPSVWALAILNMFFRGDGKSRIAFKSCFDNQERVAGHFDRVLLNPPFSQEGEPETDFINHALSSLAPGGQMVVVVKSTVMVDKKLAEWRKALVAGHHVLAAISLPVDLFYPTAVPTVILVVKAHVPDRNRGTFLARIENDGFEISKGRRIPRAGSELDKVLALYKKFLDRGAIEAAPGVACTIPRESIVNGDEICAERWLPSDRFTIAAFQEHRTEMIRQLSLLVVNHPEAVDELVEHYEELLASAGPMTGKPRQRTSLSEWFAVTTGRSSGSKNYPAGAIPYVSSGIGYNSVAAFVQPPERETYYIPHVTVTAFGAASIQPWRFCARGNDGSRVRILRPRFGMTVAELAWFAGQINAQRWRLHYGRMATIPRLRLMAVDPPPGDLPPISGLPDRLKKLRSEVRNLWDIAGGGHDDHGDAETERTFLALVKEWKSGRGHSSSINKMVRHPAYRQIVAMGKRIVPLLLRELEREPDHWFWALKEITGANPVPAESRAKVAEMAAHWVGWGREQGLRW
jgi:hypothetical protein